MDTPAFICVMYCRWMRNHMIVLLACWLIALGIFQAITGITQGALSSSISKAFSSVTSQLNAIESVKNE